MNDIRVASGLEFVRALKAEVNQLISELCVCFLHDQKKDFNFPSMPGRRIVFSFSFNSGKSTKKGNTNTIQKRDMSEVFIEKGYLLSS